MNILKLKSVATIAIIIVSILTVGKGFCADTSPTLGSLEQIRQALAERCQAVKKTPVTGSPDAGWFQAFQNKVTEIIPLYVNHLDSSGEWQGKNTIPLWTEATLLSSAGAGARLSAPTSMSDPGLKTWYEQQKKILNMLRWSNVDNMVWEEVKRATANINMMNQDAVFYNAWNRAVWVSATLPVESRKYYYGYGYWISSTGSDYGAISRTAVRFNNNDIYTSVPHVAVIYIKAGKAQGSPQTNISLKLNIFNTLATSPALLEDKFVKFQEVAASSVASYTSDWFGKVDVCPGIPNLSFYDTTYKINMNYGKLAETVEGYRLNEAKMILKWSFNDYYAPSDIAVQSTSKTEVTLNWSDNSADETGFTIERKAGSGAFTKIGTASANTASYVDNLGTLGANTYTYRVYANKSSGNSSYSAEVPIVLASISGKVTEKDASPERSMGGVKIFITGQNFTREVSTLEAGQIGTYDSGLLPAGTYAVKASKTGYIDSQSQAITIPPNTTNNIELSLSKHSLKGKIEAHLGEDGLFYVPIPNVTVNVSGTPNLSATTGADGTFQVDGLLEGNSYTVTPVKGKYTFDPANKPYNNLSAEITGCNFIANIPIAIEKVTVTQALEGFKKLVWGRAASISAYLNIADPEINIPNGAVFKNIKIAAELEGSKIIYSQEHAPVQLYVYNNKLITAKCLNEADYKLILKTWADAATTDPDNSPHFWVRPLSEDKTLIARVKVYQGDKFVDQKEDTYTVQKQNKILRIGYFAYGCSPNINQYKKCLADMFPVASKVNDDAVEEIEFVKHEFLSLEAMKGLILYLNDGNLNALPDSILKLFSNKTKEEFLQIIKQDKEGVFFVSLANFFNDLVYEYNQEMSQTSPEKEFDVYVPFISNDLLLLSGEVEGYSQGSVVVLKLKPEHLTPKGIFGGKTLNHEMGHKYGFVHPFTGKECSDEDKIYLADKGWDDAITPARITQTNEAITIPPKLNKPDWQDYNKWDFMSYTGPFWINQYHYGKLFDIFATQSYPFVAQTAQTGTRSASSKNLLVAGTIQSNGSGAYISSVSQAPVCEQAILSGPYSLEAIDLSGNVLSSTSFGISESDSEVSANALLGVGSFNIPLQEKSNIAALRINYNGQVLKTLNKTSPPQISTAPRIAESGNNVTIYSTITDSDSTDGLTYVLYYRNSADAPWSIIVSETACKSGKENTNVFSKDKLASGAACQIKVEANDGFNKVSTLTNGQEAVSSTFSVPVRAPHAYISAPVNGSVFTKNTPIVFEGYGYDGNNSWIEDEASFIWKVVSQDGKSITLGAGKKLTKSDLDLGRYQVTLTCTDQNKLTATAITEIEVDDIDNPDVSIVGIDVDPKAIALDTTKISASIKLFNVRKNVLGTVSVKAAGIELGPFEAMSIPANQVITLPVAFDKPTNPTFNIEVTVSGVDGELATENNTYILYYPVVKSMPSVDKIILYPREMFEKQGRLHAAAVIQSTDGEEITLYTWKLDGNAIAISNKPTLGLDLSSLANGDHTLSLLVKDASGTVSSAATKTFKIVTSITSIAFKRGFNMISIPIEPFDAKFSSMLNASDFIVSSTYGFDNPRYVTPTASEKGKGYWVYCKKDGATILVVGADISPDYETTLTAGWNLIGVTSKTAVPLGSIRLKRAGVVKTINQMIADKDGWISSLLWGWDASTQIYQPVSLNGTLDPWQAYWVYSYCDDDVKLMMPSLSGR